MKIILTILTAILTTMTISAQTAPPLETGVSQTLAVWRAANYSDVRYKLNITLEKGAPLMKGTIEIRVKLTDEGAKNDLILDWRTTQFTADKDKPFADVVLVNDSAIKKMPDIWKFVYLIDKEHIVVTQRLLKTGENVIKINFASPIKTSGAAITRYIDKKDGAEYVYSLFVPSDASTAFPVFDQPDLKARFSLTVDAPSQWRVISNTTISNLKIFGSTHDPNQKFHTVTSFGETQPISTYVFAFAAGSFVNFREDLKDFYVKLEDLPEDADEQQKYLQSLNKPTSQDRAFIFVRKSQAEKFKLHAAEVFRLNREGVKFLESYFDYKFPFPKYDLVLIPEFPFGGMEHAGATFLREDRVIFPTEPTKNDYITRANVIFHEAAHQWFGDTVTMRWFDDLWLKEGFAEFMAYKTLEKVMPEYNAWKIFYERNKQAAYLTDSTRGTTPIYQEIPNLSAAKSAYGNIVYRKAPSFLRQAEFYLGEDKFQTAVRAFLKKHEFANATWQDLVNEFAEVKVDEIKKGDFYQKLSGGDKVELERFTRWSIEKEWAEFWVEKRGTAIYKISPEVFTTSVAPAGFEWSLTSHGGHTTFNHTFLQEGIIKDENYNWLQDVKILKVYKNGERQVKTANIGSRRYAALPDAERKSREEAQKRAEERKRKFELERKENPVEETEEDHRKLFEEALRKQKEASDSILYVFPNYQDYGYGIFLLDEKSRAYVLANIQTEKDDFLRTMMWGALWDSVREGELNPKDYVALVIKNINVETDESTIQTLLSRVSTAMNYYLPDKQRDVLAPKVEAVLIDKMQNAPTLGQRITFYRAFLNIASSDKARIVLKEIFSDDFGIGGGNTKMRPGLIEDKQGNKTYAASPAIPMKTKDRFDIVTRLLILGDVSAPDMLAELEKYETSDEAKRYAYAAKAGIGTAANKAKFWTDFTNNKDISESYIESAFGAFNSSKHADLTLPYLERALTELPNLKKNRKIFFVNGWLASFIGGQKSEEALKIVNKFLADNPNLDKDLRLKILENADGLERAVKIRAKFANQAKN